MLYNGLLSLPWWGYIVVTLIMTHITMISVTVYLHRNQAHRALDLHPIASHFFRFWLWFTTGMKTKEWVAVHRAHHAFNDTEKDPHSPQKKGLSTVMLYGAELYRKAKKDRSLLEKFGRGTPSDWLEKYVYSARQLSGKHGVILLLILNVVLFGAHGIVMWAVEMAWTPFFAAGVINGIGHFFGYRNFECSKGDSSSNIVPWGILIAGEELHNNHHAYGNSAKFSIRWWELDMGWQYIKLMQSFGLAKVKRLPPKTVLVHNKTEVDMITVESIISNRNHLMAKFGKKVIIPALKTEHSKFGRLGKIKRLLMRDENCLKSHEQSTVDSVLDHSKSLNTIYKSLSQLKNVWDQPATSNSSLLQSLQEWCIQAEKSGVQALVDFVNYIKSYHVIKVA